MENQGHAKLLESLDKLIAFSKTLDQTRLNPPDDLTPAALQAVYDNAVALQAAVGNSKADWRTVALERQTEVDKFDSLAVQAVGLLSGRGASKESVEDARGYVRKIQGKRAASKKTIADKTALPDESAKTVSSSEQSNAQKISNFSELIDFLEAQADYANVTQNGLKIDDLRSVADAAQTKHTVSINAATKLSNDRNERNKVFYLAPNNICDLAKRFKELVKGTYGAKSLEYQTVNSIPFKKAKV